MIAIGCNGLFLLICEEKWTKILMTGFGSVDFSMYACGIFVPQMQQFCLFTYPPRSKWASSEKKIFFPKSGIFCKSIAGPLSEAKTHWMVNSLQFLNQWNIQSSIIPRFLCKILLYASSVGLFWTNWTIVYGIIPRSLCKIRFNNVSEMFKCWERRWIDWHFLPQQQYSWVNALFSLFIFEEIITQLCLWNKIRTKQWLVLSASGFQCMHAGFLCPKCEYSVCLHTRQDQNELHVKKMIFFFAKIGIFCKSIAGLLSEVKTHWMINGLQLLNQLNFVWHHTKVFMQNSPQWCLRNVELLRTTVNFCHFL